MIINKLEWKNFNSYGNILYSLEFGEEGQLILLHGKNAAGKCVSKDTVVDIDIDNEDVKELFLDFKNRKKPL